VNTIVYISTLAAALMMGIWLGHYTIPTDTPLPDIAETYEESHAIWMRGDGVVTNVIVNGNTLVEDPIICFSREDEL